MCRCSVLGCKNYTEKADPSNGHVSYHRFPSDPNLIVKWAAATGQRNWIPTKNSKICSIHFDESSFKETKKYRRLLPQAIPTIDVLKRSTCETVSEQEAQPGPSTTVTALSTRTSLDSNASKERDPLSGTIEQCRFCGEFSKDCITVSGSMPYLAANTTTLALNHTSVQLDFNNHSLPSTVCRDCDAKLQEIADFLTVVKAAQDTLINVAEERELGEAIVEYEVDKPDVIEETEIDTLVIKTEYDSQDEEDGNDKEDKEGIVDSLTIGETVFVKKSSTNKRKSDAVTAKPKKLKAKTCDSSDSELIVDIKEEVIEKEDGQGQSGVSDSDVKPSELELATSALMFEMAGEGTREYQGYRSDR